MSDKPELPPDDFIQAINQEARDGLRLTRTQYTALIAMAKGYQRPDLAAMYEELRAGVDLAIDILDHIDDKKGEN